MTWEVSKMTTGYDTLIDLIIANPTATNIELGRQLNRTPTWVGLVKNSGMFLERLHARRTEMFDPILSATIEDKLKIVANRSLEVIMEKISKRSEDVPDALALEAAKLGAKGLAIGGFSTKPPAPPEAPPVGRLERLADRLLALAPVQIPSQVIEDVQFTEVTQAAAG